MIESFFTYGMKGLERWNMIMFYFYFWMEGGREIEYHIDSFLLMEGRKYRDEI